MPDTEPSQLPGSSNFVPMALGMLSGLAELDDGDLKRILAEMYPHNRKRINKLGNYLVSATVEHGDMRCDFDCGYCHDDGEEVPV
jgi:hypothetical protein